MFVCFGVLDFVLEEVEYERGYVFKRGRVQALGKVPVGHAGGRQCPLCGSWCRCVWTRDEREREKKRGDADEVIRAFSLSVGSALWPSC